MSEFNSSNPDARRHLKRRLGFEALEQRQLLAGDIEHLYDMVHDIAASYIQCPATCDDVVQETVIKVVRHWDKLGFLAQSKQNAYIAKTTRNTFVDQLRSDARQEKLVERVFSEKNRSNPLDPVEISIAAEDEQTVQRWLDDQEQIDAKIWKLRQGGMTLDAISMELNLPKSTVQHRCQRLFASCFRELS